MNIYKEFVIPKDKAGDAFKLIGEVVHFNKCHYFVSSVDCNELKVHKEFVSVRVHFSPHEFDASTEVNPFPQFKDTSIDV